MEEINKIIEASRRKYRRPQKIEDLPSKPPTVAADLKVIDYGNSLDPEYLKKIAEKLIPVQDSKTETELINTLLETGGSKEDAVNLINVMRYRNIIDRTSIGTYYLSSSTPF